jgi:MFS family permease
VATLPFVLLGVVYPPEKRGRALGAASTAWAIASVAGPLLGTLIVTHVSWRWAFLINVPIAIVAAFLVIAGMRESIGQSVGRFDLAGASSPARAGAL